MPAAVWRKRAFAPVPGLIGCVALATALSGCWEGTTSETLATVLSIEGTAEISTDNGRTFAPLRPTDHPEKRATLRTTPGSKAILAPLPNALVLQESDTSLEIVRLALTKDGNETGSDVRGRYVDLKLIRGRLLVSHSWGGAFARFTVATDQGELIVTTNALAWLETDGTKTRVICASGSVELRANGSSNTTRIASGFVGESSGTNVTLTPADADAAAQEGVVQALQLEPRLSDLAFRHRDLLPR